MEGSMARAARIIYSLNTEDIQNVAEEELGRKLSKKELKIVEDKIGDYVDWYGAIDMAIQNGILNLDEHAVQE